MRLSLNLHLMEHIWSGLYLNSEMWECHTGRPIWHVTYWWELWGFDWVLSISFVRENTRPVFRVASHTGDQGAACCCFKTQRACHVSSYETKQSIKYTVNYRHIAKSSTSTGRRILKSEEFHAELCMLIHYWVWSVKLCKPVCIVTRNFIKSRLTLSSTLSDVKFKHPTSLMQDVGCQQDIPACNILYTMLAVCLAICWMERFFAQLFI